jgi:CheY-like chemotaxis protein
MSPGVILYVEDEEDDVYLLRHVFKEAGIANPIVSVVGGEAAMDYLKGAGPYANRSDHPLPVLLLLDINLPLVSGLEVLAWLRSKSAVPALPTLILSSSSQPSDVRRAYQFGANAYLIKPSGLAQLLTMAKAIHDFWLVQNQPPPGFEYPKRPDSEELEMKSRG